MILLSILGIAIFFLLNVLIIVSDYSKKIIPNKYLLCLLWVLPLYYWYIIFEISSPISIWTEFIQLILSLILSFLLYFHGVWSAWDAKYLLVLSLYLPNAGIIPFIGNLACITILYLFGYYIYFYARFFFRGKRYIFAFWESISKDKSDSWKAFLERYYTDRSLIWRIFRFVLVFLIFFVSIRLIRGYLISETQNIVWVHALILQYPTYAALFFGSIFFGIFYLFRKISIKIKSFFSGKFSGSKYIVYAENIFPFILFLFLIGFIWVEYKIHPDDIKHRLFLIFTLYLALYFLIKILYYSYKVTFQMSELNVIGLSKLSEGDIVDKQYLIQFFWIQESLWYNEDNGILGPNPALFFQNISNPIDRETVIFLKKIYKIVNTYHKEHKTPGFQKLEEIKVLHTFAFAGYIFLAFLITFIWEDFLIHFLMENTLELLHSIK